MEKSHVGINVDFCASSNCFAADGVWDGTGASRKLRGEHSGESLLKRSISDYYGVVGVIVVTKDQGSENAAAARHGPDRDEGKAVRRVLIDRKGRDIDLNLGHGG